MNAGEHNRSDPKKYTPETYNSLVVLWRPTSKTKRTTPQNDPKCNLAGEATQRENCHPMCLTRFLKSTTNPPTITSHCTLPATIWSKAHVGQLLVQSCCLRDVGAKLVQGLTTVISGCIEQGSRKIGYIAVWHAILQSRGHLLFIL
jgi:hypothetical protein